MRKKVRFWDIAPNGGLVRITLEKGKPLHHNEAHATDEGWSATGQRWEYDGERVTCSQVTDGVDCDGRMTSYQEVSCPVGLLHAGEVIDGHRFPRWQKDGSSQRDYTAESMGY